MQRSERLSTLRWLLAAFLLHALLLLGVRSSWAPAPAASDVALAAKVSPPSAAVELEVMLEEQSLGSAHESAGTWAPEQPGLAAPAARVALRADPSEVATQPAAGGAELAGLDERAVAPTETPGPASAPVATAPTRSLAELGYGKTLSATVSPYLEYAPLAAAQARLDRNLAQATLDRDRNRSQGMDGPVANALRQAAFAVVAPDSLAKVALIIDADGKLADFRIVSSNQDPALLRKLADGVARQLAAQRIRMPNGRAIEFIYEVKSEVLLPSGRAPGMNVSALGIPIKKGHSAKSSQLSILPLPSIALRSSTEPDPERNGQTMQTPPGVVITLPGIALDADLVDIGAVGRQVVHTRLVRQRVL